MKEPAQYQSVYGQGGIAPSKQAQEDAERLSCLRIKLYRILLKKAECGMKNSEFIFEAADDIRLQRMGKLEEPP